MPPASDRGKGSRRRKRGAPPPPAAAPPQGRKEPHRYHRLLAAVLTASALFLVGAGYLWWRGSGGPFRGDTSAYNVLLVTLDTTRADHLGCYGDSRAGTPVLDRLAESAVLFESAYTPAVITLPSHTSILTGLLPPAHGVRNNGGERLAPEVETLAEILKAARFRTGAVIAAFVLEARYGLDQGFDTYDDYFQASDPESAEPPRRTATQVTDAAVRWLRKSDGGRWFLWAHYYDPHSPYDPPPAFREKHAGRPYDGEISYMDAEIGRLLEGVAGIGAREKTIVVVVGDHGEGMRDHGEGSHGVFLYDETSRVPMFVSVPGHADRSKRVRSVVRTTDLFPTILDLLHLPARDGLDGESLWPLIAGSADGPGRLAYSEATSPLHMYGWSPIASLREEGWKYIQAPKPELYDMSSDPKELKNLASEEKDRATSMKGKLKRIFDSSTEAGLEAGEVAPSQEEKAKLRSLGYVGSPVAAASLLESDPAALLDGGAHGLVDPKDRVVQLGRITDLYAFFTSQEYDRAVDLARSILAEEPDNLNVRQHLADALRAIKRLNEASVEYRALMDRDPTNVEYILNLGWVLMTQKHYEDARATIQKALVLEPDHQYALAGMGNVWFAEGNAAKAEEYYRKILAMRPDSRQTILALARIVESQGKHHDAAELYRRAVDLDPGDVEARLSFAWTLMKAKEYQPAIDTLNEAAAANPGMADLDLFRADIYLEMGRLPDSERLYREANAKAPKEPMGYHGLGKVAAARGDLAAARRFFEQALEIDPRFDPARQELARMKGAHPAGG